MIELYTAPTPNGHKVSCTLEALKMDYKAILVNLSEGEQKKPDFLKISPMEEFLQLLIHQITYQFLNQVQL